MKMTYQHMNHDKGLSTNLLLISSLYLLIYTFYSGGNCLEVYTSVGDDAVLPCEVDPTTDNLAVEWSRTDLPPDQYVYFQRNGLEFDDDKSPSFRGRTSLFMDEVKKGNVSLKLSRVEPSDEGNYTCVLPDETFTVQLIVVSVSADDVSEDRPRSNGGHEDRPAVAASEVKPDEVGEFPWWGYVIITLGIIIIIISVLVYKRQSILEFVRNFHPPEDPAGNEDRSVNGESVSMNEVSVDNPEFG